MNQALYRRYRPQTFGEVIGQEHVTEPLMQALRTGRVSHAYLFSGPRGCGKTTCARILARCLNCEKGPTPEPCGECASCQELGRGGSGSLDVVEIDAASHGGVDDTRDLREKAVFAPARDRYKVFVLDEAHMVSREGFNALLKIVEEPPPHVKFIFATTEPNKVLPTIRSRSHHYPFRLVPPGLMTSYMEELSQAEGVEVAPGVMQMVVRAGGGSVRDTESVLDQLIGGSVDGRVTYERASALLGFTPDELIGQMVSALGRGDGASMFAVIESVVESGLEPHRFAEDLLERLRDLIVLAAAGPSARQALRGLPEDQVAALAEQAAQLGLFRLTRAADSVSAGLASMAGATSPRLHLELLAARALMAAQPPQQGLAQVPDAVRSPSQQPPPASAPAGQRGPGAPPARGQAPHPPEGAPGVSATFSRGTAPHRPADASGPGEAGTEPGGRGQPQRAGAPLAPGSPGQAGGPPRGGSAPADGWAIPGVTTGAAWAESDRSRRPAGRRSDGHGPESAGQAAQAGPAIPHPTHPDQRGAGAAPGPQTARPIRQFVDWDEPEAAPPPRSPQSGAAGPGQPGEREQRGQSGQPLRPGEPGEPDPGGQSRRPARAGRSAGPGDPARTQPPLGPGQTPGLRADGPIPPRPASAPPDAQTRVRPQATSDHPVGAPGPSNAPAAHNQSARGDQAAGPVGSRPAPAAPVAEGEQERWRQLLEQVRHHSVAAHGLLSHSARPMGAGQGQLKLVFPTPDLASAFTRRFHALVEQAATEAFGQRISVTATVEGEPGILPEGEPASQAPPGGQANDPRPEPDRPAGGSPAKAPPPDGEAADSWAEPGASAGESAARKPQPGSEAADQSAEPSSTVSSPIRQAPVEQAPKAPAARERPSAPGQASPAPGLSEAGAAPKPALSAEAPSQPPPHAAPATVPPDSGADRNRDGRDRAPKAGGGRTASAADEALEDEPPEDGQDAGVRGLTGVPLVMEMLGGEIIEETDEP